jgi:outer membrane protein assembly factor BamB
MANGNDGPFKDEARLATPSDQDPEPLSELDADVLWLFDVPSQAGTYPHDAAHASILLDGPFLYLNTSNGVDNTHRKIRKPDAPSLIVLDKTTGRLLARDNEGIGPRIFHSTWSSPGVGTIGDRRFVYFAGGDGVVYAFEPLKNIPPEGTVEILKRIWKFDPDPMGPKENVSQYLTNREISPSNIKGMAVYDSGRIYAAVGGDIWWGKNQAWLKCFRAEGIGDISSSALVWSYDLNRHSCSTPAVFNGMVFAADTEGIFHCIDAETGKAIWTHDLGGEIWASPMVADNKVYLGTRKGDLYIFAVQKDKKLLAEIKLDAPISATVTCANKTLYIATNKTLYAATIK